MRKEKCERRMGDVWQCKAYNESRELLIVRRSWMNGDFET
jgi:hypothetical protein